MSPPVALSVAIQHHPARSGLLPALLARLGEPVDVIADPAPDPSEAAPSPWRTYQHALALTPLGATHRLILQDDVEACRGLLPAVRAAITARPDRLLVLFVSGQYPQARRLMPHVADCGVAWMELRTGGWCPVVANVWPTWMISPCIEYVASQQWPERFRADDEIVGRYLQHDGHIALATVPSLVEHPDRVPSLVTSGRAKDGQDPNRVAACYIGDCDPALIDWGPGPR